MLLTCVGIRLERGILNGSANIIRGNEFQAHFLSNEVSARNNARGKTGDKRKMKTENTKRRFPRSFSDTQSLLAVVRFAGRPTSFHFAEICYVRLDRSLDKFQSHRS